MKMSVEKISLTSFRCLQFFFFAGVGCLLPFISLHLKSSGLSGDDIRTISYASPIFASLGPTLIGLLVDYFSARRNEIKKSNTKTDRNAYIRTVLSITVLLSIVFYCLLLSVPVVREANPRDDQKASLVCNEHGAAIVHEKCTDYMSCFPNKEKTGTAVLGNCRFDCNFPSHYGYIENPNEDAEVERRTNPPSVPAVTMVTTQQPRFIRPEIDVSNLDDFFGAEPNDDSDEADFGSGEDSEFNWNKNHRKRDAKGDAGLSLEESPHICHDRLTGPPGSRTCFVFTPNSAAFNVTIVVKPPKEDDRHCNYPIGDNFSCRIPRGLEKPSESCKVVCDVEEFTSTKHVIYKFQCGQVYKLIQSFDPEVSFWTYLTFRSLGDLFFSATIALLIGATLVATEEEAGREFILPSLAYGFFSIVVGYLHSDDLSPLQLENIPNFFLGIVGYGFFSVIALLILVFATNLSVGPPDWWRNSRNSPLKHKGEFLSILFVLVLLGILWGPIYFHVPWHINEPGGLELYVGCAAAIGALLSVPFVWKAYKVVDYCGYANILIGAFTIYILRYTGLLFIENPWVLSVIGAMEAITLCLMLFSAVFYVRHIVPKNMTFRSQGLVVAAHFCVGGGLGCLISTLLSPYDTELDWLSRNTTQVDVNNPIEWPNQFKPTYRLIYCAGAIAAAVIAVLYFFAYHCCFKKRCLAPLYRSDHNGSVPHDSAENGMYTPLRIIRNGRQTSTET